MRTSYSSAEKHSHWVTQKERIITRKPGVDSIQSEKSPSPRDGVEKLQSSQPVPIKRANEVTTGLWTAQKWLSLFFLALLC